MVTTEEESNKNNRETLEKEQSIKENNNQLKRHLNLFGLCIFGIGIIIGAGIYSVIGLAYGHAEGSLWLSFVLGAVAAILTAFSYCELATMFPSAGAEYIYLRKAYPKTLFPSFMVAMILLIAGAATASTVAIAFSGYLQFFVSVSPLLSAILLMCFATFINYFGIRSSNKVNVLLTLIEISGIILVIWFGMTAKNPVMTPTFNLHKGTLIASSLIFFVYLGFEDIANLAEEVKEPSKNIPRAILLSLFITTIFYVAVSFSVIALANPQTLAGSKFPLAQALAGVAPQMEKILSGIALFSTGNTVLITLLVGSRMLFSVAREGDLPDFLGRTHQEYSSPHAASFIFLLVSIIFLFVGNLEILAGLSSFSALVGFLVVNFAVIVLRYKESKLPRPFLIPLNIGRFPILSALGVLITFFMCLQFSRQVYEVSGVIILVCGLYYFYKKRH